eukprot:882480_1
MQFSISTRSEALFSFSSLVNRRISMAVTIESIKSNPIKCSLATITILLSLISGALYLSNSILPMPELTSESDISEQFIKISVVGDISISRDIDQSIHHRFESNFDAFTSRFSHITSTDDLTLANLESPITDHHILPFTPFYSLFLKSYINDRRIRLCSPSINVELLKSASIDVVSLASNHMFDCTQHGILDTISILNENHIDYVGVGLIKYHRQRLMIREVDGVSIGILGFYANDIWFDARAIYTPSYENITDQLDNATFPSFIDQHLVSQYLCEDLRSYKEDRGVDVLIVYMHWFHENIFDGDEDYAVHSALYNMTVLLSQCGVDVIVGSHPHVLLQPQWINHVYDGEPQGVLVLWSMGNFIFDSHTHVDRTHRTCLTQLLVDRNSKRLSKVRFMEGHITKSPQVQTVLTGTWQSSFCSNGLKSNRKIDLFLSMYPDDN